MSRHRPTADSVDDGDKMATLDETTIDQIARLYDRRDQRPTRVQRMANRITSAAQLIWPSKIGKLFELDVNECKCHWSTRDQTAMALAMILATTTMASSRGCARRSRATVS